MSHLVMFYHRFDAALSRIDSTDRLEMVFLASDLCRESLFRKQPEEDLFAGSLVTAWQRVRPRVLSTVNNLISISVLLFRELIQPSNAVVEADMSRAASVSLSD
jgi:hypothetical protein